MKNKTQPQIKKVKIDEHIRQIGQRSSQQTVKRGRGRPRKVTEHSAGGSGTLDEARGDQAFSVTDPASMSEGSNVHQPTEVQPVYDTTEEAKAFLSAPFSIVAGLTGIKELDLYPSQLDALAPSFKLVYDKRIAPNMGEHADLIAFGICASGVLFEKVQVYRDYVKQNQPKKAEVMSEPTTIETVKGD